MFLCEPDVIKDPVCMLEEDLSIFCECDRAAFPLKQNDPEFLFQVGDGVAQGRLRNGKFRGGEAEMLAASKKLPFVVLYYK